jgi:hypothetical protein
VNCDNDNNNDIREREYVKTISISLESNVGSPVRDDEYDMLINNVHLSSLAPNSFSLFFVQ